MSSSSLLKNLDSLPFFGSFQLRDELTGTGKPSVVLASGPLVGPIRGALHVFRPPFHTTACARSFCRRQRL